MSASATEGTGAETLCCHHRLCLPHPMSFHSLHAPCQASPDLPACLCSAIPQPRVPSPPSILFRDPTHLSPRSRLSRAGTSMLGSSSLTALGPRPAPSALRASFILLVSEMKARRELAPLQPHRSSLVPAKLLTWCWSSACCGQALPLVPLLHCTGSASRPRASLVGVRDSPILLLSHGGLVTGMRRVPWAQWGLALAWETISTPLSHPHQYSPRTSPQRHLGSHHLSAPLGPLGLVFLTLTPRRPLHFISSQAKPLKPPLPGAAHASSRHLALLLCPMTDSPHPKSPSYLNPAACLSWEIRGFPSPPPLIP